MTHNIKDIPTEPTLIRMPAGAEKMPLPMHIPQISIVADKMLYTYVE